MKGLTIAKSVSELYRFVLVDTPLAPYFQDCLSEEDLDEMNIEIIRFVFIVLYLCGLTCCSETRYIEHIWKISIVFVSNVVVQHGR